MERPPRSDGKTGGGVEFTDRPHRKIRDRSACRKQCIINVTDDQAVHREKYLRNEIFECFCRSNSIMI